MSLSLEEFTRSLINGIVVRIDRNGVITDWLPEISEFLGFTHEEALGARLDTLTLSKPERWWESNTDIIDMKTVCGSQVYVSATVSKQQDGFYLVMKDITQAQMHARIESISSFIKLQASVIKHDFISNVVSHEIKTALNTLNMNIGQLEAPQDGLLYSARLLELTVNNVLSYVGASAENFPVGSDQVELMSFVQGISKFFRWYCEANDIRFNLVNNLRMERLLIDTDSNQMEQVLHIPLYYMSGKQGLTGITTALESASSALLINVQGFGIDIAEDIEKIVRWKAEDIQNFKLRCMNVARLLVLKALKGKMNVIIHAGTAQVWITFPVKNLKDDMEKKSDSMSILIVDDNPLNRKLLRKQLERMGHSVHEAGGGLAAVEMISLVHVDFVFMDVQMPDVDGYAATREMRQQKFWKTIVASSRVRNGRVLSNLVERRISVCAIFALSRLL